MLVELGVKLDAVVNFCLPLDEIVARLSGRRTCSGCKAVFHVTGRPPKVAGVCDHCGGQLIQREDDRPESVRVAHGGLRAQHRAADRLFPEAGPAGPGRRPRLAGRDFPAVACAAASMRCMPRIESFTRSAWERTRDWTRSFPRSAWERGVDAPRPREEWPRSGRIGVPTQSVGTRHSQTFHPHPWSPAMNPLISRRQRLAASGVAAVELLAGRSARAEEPKHRVVVWSEGTARRTSIPTTSAARWPKGSNR